MRAILCYAKGYKPINAMTKRENPLRFNKNIVVSIIIEIMKAKIF